MHYPVNIHHIFISPGHNYFGRPKDGPGDYPTQDVEQVEARARLGLVGDRYFGVKAHFDAQITFVAWEVFTVVQAELGLSGLSPSLMRRNVVIEGVPLNQLIEREFALDFGDQRIRFLGVRHCAPCAWMDAMIGPGAWTLLKGRGGLRARVLNDGVLRRGPALLQTEASLDLAAITETIAYPRLP
jgi:MOSC domain-containing protein YiiM